MQTCFQFDSSVSWKVIFFHVFGQNALISLCLVSPGYQNNEKKCVGKFELIHVAIIVEGVDFVATFLFYGQYFHYGNTVP